MSNFMDFPFPFFSESKESKNFKIVSYSGTPVLPWVDRTARPKDLILSVIDSMVSAHRSSSDRFSRELLGEDAFQELLLHPEIILPIPRQDYQEKVFTGLRNILLMRALRRTNFSEYDDRAIRRTRAIQRLIFKLRRRTREVE